MVDSLAALLTGIIDYAGLFPPAQLPLDEAFRNYVRYQQESENWMLGRFICPAGRLAELAPLLDATSRPIPLSVLIPGSRSTAPFAETLAHDLQAIQEFVTSHQGQASIDIVELRLPALDGGDLPRQVAAAIEGLSLPLTPYHEVPWPADWPRAIPALLAAIADDNRASTAARRWCRPAGFKLRCGGLEPAAFPSPEQVAFAMAACRDAKVSLKFTAGLHHPLRHFNAGVQTKMHGFINVFVAGVLAFARNLNSAQIEQILTDEEASHFGFTDEGLRWQGHVAIAAEVRAARHSFATSFGSCSFDEPRADLRTLGWL